MTLADVAIDQARSIHPRPRTTAAVLAGLLIAALALGAATWWYSGRGPVPDLFPLPRPEALPFGGGADSVPVGSPRVVVTPWQSQGGTVTIESIRLAHSVVGLSATFAVSSQSCGSGIATASILVDCHGLAAPHGARLSPTGTSTLVISYQLTGPQPVEIHAPDVLVTYRAGLRTRTVGLGLDICLSSTGAPSCW